jgi:hypothetical protein
VGELASHRGGAPGGGRGRADGCATSSNCAIRAGAFSYEVGGVPVGDFLLPGFYRSAPCGTNRYSHLGRLTAPLQVADGGYISFINPADGHAWARFVTGDDVRDKDWGPQQLESQMLRERIDVLAAGYRTTAS